jgi:hypothetical protein
MHNEAVNRIPAVALMGVRTHLGLISGPVGKQPFGPFSMRSFIRSMHFLNGDLR